MVKYAKTTNSSVTRMEIACIEIDAFSLIKKNEQYIASIAEVKWTLTYEMAIFGIPEKKKILL